MTFTHNTKTNANGLFHFPTDGPVTNVVQPRGNGFVFTPDSRTVASNASDVDFQLITGSIAGRITAGGEGLAGVTVTAGGVSVTTDANGDYLLSGLASGSYPVTASLAGYGLLGAKSNS